MGARPAAPWRRLVPLTVAVLAAHLLLLQWAPPAPVRPAPVLAFTVVPPSPRWGEGQARQLAADSTPPSPGAAQPDAQPAPVAAPAPIAPPKPAPRSRPRPQRAPASAPPLLEASLPLPAQPASGPVVPPTPALAVAIPPSMLLHYEIAVRTHGFQLSGSAELDWRQDGRSYDARLEMRSFGLPARVQHSTGAVTPQGLAPSYFSDKARNELAVHFDRAHGRLVFSNNRADAPIAAGMQDRLSVVLQLAGLVAGDPARYPAGTQIAVPTASARDAEDWIFRVDGEEDLDLPGGRVRALKLERLPRQPYDQQVELWLAPRRDYAPLGLRLTNPNGDAADLRWSSTDRPGAALPLN